MEFQKFSIELAEGVCKRFAISKRIAEKFENGIAQSNYNGTLEEILKVNLEEIGEEFEEFPIKFQN